MIEIIATVWLVCFILSSLIVCWNYLTLKRKLASPELGQLNANLKKVGLFWMHNRGDFGELQERNTPERDAKSLLRSALFMEAFAVASVAGLLLLLIVIVTMHFVGVHRREKAVLASPLAENLDLAPEQIHQLVSELRLII